MIEVSADSCAQIMYSFILRPDTLPRSYCNWSVYFIFVQCHFPYIPLRIQAACKVPRDAVTMNRSLVREGFFDVSLIDGLLAAKVSVLYQYSLLLDTHNFAERHCKKPNRTSRPQSRRSSSYPWLRTSIWALFSSSPNVWFMRPKWQDPSMVHRL